MNQATTCPTTLKLLGDYWTLRIIDALSGGETRYCELQRRLDNLNPVTLTARLKKLEQAQLVGRREETCDRVSVAYSLTTLGKQALPVIKAMTDFSQRAKQLA